MIIIEIKNNVGVYVRATPSLTGSKFENNAKGARSELITTMQAKFFGDDYDMITAIADTYVYGKVYQNGMLQTEVRADNTTGNINANNREITLNFQSYDYNAIIDESKDVEFNVLEVEAQGTFTYKQPTSYQQITGGGLKTVAIPDGPDGMVYYFDYVDAAAPTTTAPQLGIIFPTLGDASIWGLVRATYTGISIISGTLTYNLATIFATEIAYTANKVTEPAGAGWVYMENVIVGGVSISKWGRYPTDIPLDDYIYANTTTQAVPRFGLGTNVILTYTQKAVNKANRQYN